LAARAAKSEATTFKPLRGVKAISRRSAISRVGIGIGLATGAYFGVKKIVARIPFWLGAKRRYSLLMSFGPHERIRDAKPVSDEVRRAKEAGEPYHVCFVESADVSVVDFAQQVKNYKQRARIIPQLYKQYRKQGFSDEDARLIIARNIHTTDPQLNPFNIEQMINLTMEGVRIIPIEKHTIRNAARLKFLFGKLKIADQRLVVQRKSGKSLLEQQRTVVRIIDIIRQMNIIRNPMFENVVERFKDAERFFPELKNLPQIRAIGYLGSGHRTLYFTFNHYDSGIQLEEIKSIYGKSPIGDFQLRLTPGKEPGKKEERITVLTGYLGKQVGKLLRRGQKKYEREIYRLIPLMTQKEFEELSRLTIGIPDENKRGIFILNYLFGREILK